jgi:hypothetical protein
MQQAAKMYTSTQSDIRNCYLNAVGSRAQGMPKSATPAHLCTVLRLTCHAVSMLQLRVAYVAWMLSNMQ